jgi:hypothetical protein
MAQLALTTKAALIAALTLALAACGKQEELPAAQSPDKAALTVAECDKLPDPKPADDSAAGKATAVSQGVAAREACKKTAAKGSDDLARIREIMEKQEAERTAVKKSEEEWKRGINESAGKPLKEYKY